MRTTCFIGFSAIAFGLVSGCSSNSSPAGSADSGRTSDSETPLDSGGHDAGTHTDAAVRDGAMKDGHVVATTDSGKGVDAHSEGATATMDAAKSDAHASNDTGVDVNVPEVVAVSGPERVLVTFGNGAAGELVAVNVANKAVDGRLAFGNTGTADSRNVSAAFLLEQVADNVVRLDNTSPWLIDSIWNVRLTDGPDGGPESAMPVQVVVDTSEEAHVLRYERNEIAVINESQAVDGGAPTSTVDLSSFVQSGDSDGLVDMTAAAFVPATHRLYVVLGNINQNLEATYGAVICGTTVSTVVAIDTTSGSIVSLGGTGPHGSIQLTYFNPYTMVFDEAGNRLIVVQSGCYAMPATPGDALGVTTKGGVEAVNLTTGASTSLLPLVATDFTPGFVDVPTSFAYIDSTHAVIGFDSTGQAVYAWDPTTTKIGSAIPNAPDLFVYDGKGHLVGTRVDTTDAGVVSTDIVSVTTPQGVSTTLASNVTKLTGTVFVSSVDVWPHP